VNITLSGNSVGGWGYPNGTITKPGPDIPVYLGDDVRLTLNSTDGLGVRHNWFIDYNNDSTPNGDEPTSPDFNIPGSAVVMYEFNPLHPGNWTYRCQYHSDNMFGTIRVKPEPRPVSVSLHGSTSGGWGYSNATMKNPGPPLLVLWGTNVTLTLFPGDSTDTAMHNWFIDYDNSQSPTNGEPSSPDFNVPPGTAKVFPFEADRSGNYTYYCRYHFLTMRGNISIVGGPPPPFPGAKLPLITSIMLGALAIVLVFAAVYHYRAVRAAKRVK